MITLCKHQSKPRGFQLSPGYELNIVPLQNVFNVCRNAGVYDSTAGKKSIALVIIFADLSLSPVPIPWCSILEISSDSVKYVGGVVICSLISSDACFPPGL